MSDTASTHHVLGKEVAMPVQVRTATAFMAMYSVPTGPAQALIADSDLEILQYRPGGRGLCTLVFVDYIDGDLGPYNEFGGVCFLVRDHNRRGGTVFQDLRELGSGGAGGH